MAQEPNILEQVREWLETKNLSELERETEYSYQWLWQVRENQIANPGIARILKLNEIRQSELPSSEHSE